MSSPRLSPARRRLSRRRSHVQEDRASRRILVWGQHAGAMLLIVWVAVYGPPILAASVHVLAQLVRWTRS